MTSSSHNRTTTPNCLFFLLLIFVPQITWGYSCYRENLGGFPLVLAKSLCTLHREPFHNAGLSQKTGLLPLIQGFSKSETAVPPPPRIPSLRCSGAKRLGAGRWLLWTPYLCRTSRSRPLFSSITRRSVTISCCTISSCLRACCLFLVSFSRSLLFASSPAPRRASLSPCCLCLSDSRRARFSRTFSGSWRQLMKVRRRLSLRLI